ncbi:hypothetical protein HDK90DRAFT_471006 [Phyllosticta capitalensis]|uniref:Uncharacterized protein n=1 Tax=Phyllosticta capitalensis TaxID=121624 RepID=A0ABR1Y9A7_9PEZI
MPRGGCGLRFEAAAGLFTKRKDKSRAFDDVPVTTDANEGKRASSSSKIHRAMYRNKPLPYLPPPSTAELNQLRSNAADNSAKFEATWSASGSHPLAYSHPNNHINVNADPPLPNAPTRNASDATPVARNFCQEDIDLSAVSRPLTIVKKRPSAALSKATASSSEPVSAATAQTGSEDGEDRSDVDNQTDRADSVNNSEEHDECKVGRAVMEMSESKPRHVQQHSRSKDTAQELRAIIQEINALKESQAMLEEENEQWRRAYLEMKQERDGLIQAGHAALEKRVIEGSKRMKIIRHLNKEVDKLEQELEEADRDTDAAKRELSRFKEQHANTSKGKVREFEAKLVRAYKVINALKYDLAKAQDLYTKLISDATELVKTIHALDKSPSMVIEAAQKFSNKIVRPWISKKD